ncbi:MAG: hypothetical protein V3V34_11850 [Kiloniellales bacterium]
MAHVTCEAIVDYPCIKDGRPHVAGRGAEFELHAMAALTAQRRGKLRIVGPSKIQLAAIKARAKRLEDKAMAKKETAIATDNAAAMSARIEQLERRVAKAEAKAKK